MKFVLIDFRFFCYLLEISPGSDRLRLVVGRRDRLRDAHRLGLPVPAARRRRGQHLEGELQAGGAG